MFTSSSADISTAASVGLHNSVHGMVNAASNAAMNDPSSVKTLIDQLDHSIDGIVASSPIKGVDSAKIRSELREKAIEQIVMSGAYGAAQKSPNAVAEVQKWIKQYPDYINGPKAIQLIRAAQSEDKKNAAYERQTMVLQKQLDELNTHQDANRAFINNIQTDQNGRPLQTPDGRLVLKPDFFKDALDVAKKNPNSPNAANVAKTLLDWGESQQREHPEHVKSDPNTKTALYTGIFAANRPTTEIDVMKAEINKKLSPQDAQQQRQLIQLVDGAKIKGPVYQSAIDGAKERLGVSTIFDGHERFANFMGTFWPEYIKEKNAGTLPPDALDLKNPDSLIRKSMKEFEPTTEERLRGHLFKSLGGAPMNITSPDTAVTGVAVEDKPIKLPDMKDRVSGQTYLTPSGPKKWTGTGWITP